MKYPYQDPSLSVEERIADLLPRMTLEEKFSQMRLLHLGHFASECDFDLSILEENTHRAGALYNNISLPVETINKIQDWYLHNTPLGIPTAIHGESLHGFLSAFGTVFPQSIGLGATFDRDLMTDIVTQIGKEARACGVTMTYAPNLDLSRDPRWGRVEENYGEDPYLTAELGKAYVNALQAQGVAACVKHFIAHGSPESGINLAPVHIGEREFRETMAVPFEKAFVEAKAMGAMPAYSEWDGVPVHASHRLLTELLRDEWGCRGPVVSDYGAIKMLHRFQKVAETETKAGEMALRAGVDVEAPKVIGFNEELVEKVRNGEIPEALVDLAVSRILRHKFEMGLFENPYAKEDAPGTVCRTEEALALTKKAAQASMVLLKNEGVLPLSDSVGKVALIGPNADVPQLGGYTDESAMARTVTLKAAMEARLGKDRVLYAAGCGISKGSDKQKQEALDAAKAADVVVMVMGDNSNYYGGIGWGNAEIDGSVTVTCGEGFDMHTLDLPGRQQELMEALHATGKPVVLVLETGRPYAITWAKEHIPAILQAWYPGEMGGTALCEVLFGDFNPCGRLPISFPQSVGHIPVFYNHKVSARGYYKKPGTPEASGRDYVFASPNALFPFGHGLSYTTFTYSDLTAKVTGKTDAEITVTVENTGKMAGHEVVLLYVSDVFCRITPFVKQLRGFEKIFLAPGEKKTLTFALGFEDFAFINEKMEREVEPGEFIIRVGTEETSLTLA